MGWGLLIIFYKGTRRGQATESQRQTLWALQRVWAGARPQTTEHDMKALHFLANDGLTQNRLVFSFLFMVSLAFREVLTVQSGTRVEEKHRTSLFQLITIPSHKPTLICIPFNLRGAGGKKNANIARRNWACPYLNTIRPAVARGLGLFCCWQPRRCVFC